MKRVRGGGLGGGAGFVTLILRMQIRSRDGNQRPADRFYGCLCKVPIDNTFALSGRGCVAVVTQGAASLALGYGIVGLSARSQSAVRSLRAVFSPFSVCRAFSASCFQPVLGLPCALSELFSARFRSAVRSLRAVFSPFSVCRAFSASCFQPVFGLPCVLCELFSARSRSAVRSQRAVFSPFSVCRALSASCFQPVFGLPCVLSGRAESCSLAWPERPTIP